MVTDQEIPFNRRATRHLTGLADGANRWNRGLRIQDEATVLPFFLDPFTGKNEGGVWHDGGYAL